ncbi:MAG: phosphotransferase [Opitutaceae bacterium]|nr:phosphotransferase [Opitutaceae bacterium]
MITIGKWADNIADVHGEKGKGWLKLLPETIAACADRWSLHILPPFEELSYNYVTPATTSDGMSVVIKAGVPSKEVTSEIEALRAFNGKGISRLLDADIDLGVMLLERLQPGTFLSDIDNDEEVTRCAASVMQRLCTRAPAHHNFKLLSHWANQSLSEVRTQFEGGYGPLPIDLIDLAQSYFTELLDPRNEQTLIHGDFHPQNILRSERDSWLAIDPKGIVGDPLYDIAVFVCQPPRRPTGLDPKKFLSRRIDQIGEALAVDRQLLTKWCFAHSVLSGCWASGDHGGNRWKPAFSRARILESL